MSALATVGEDTLDGHDCERVWHGSQVIARVTLISTAMDFVDLDGICIFSVIYRSLVGTCGLFHFHLQSGVHLTSHCSIGLLVHFHFICEFTLLPVISFFISQSFTPTSHPLL